MNHAIFPRVKPLDGIIWNCECGESGFDVYDLPTHTNNIIDKPAYVDGICSNCGVAETDREQLLGHELDLK